MSDSGGLNDQHPDLDTASESKSSASHESGLCSAMLAMDESLGSLEELTDSVHQQLDDHIDHTTLLQYELDLLRSQLADKNRLITVQQNTIKQLQEALSASHRELKDVRKAAETEITCKNETINILQSDLVECQQQYADCFQQVVSQDRLLSEIRDDDAILIQKVAQLELQLRKKASRTIATQTDPLTRAAPPSYNPPPAVSRQHRFWEERSTDPPDFEPLIPAYHSTPNKAQRNIQDHQDLLFEIRQIQQTLSQSHSCPAAPRVKPEEEDMTTRFWNVFTEERQQRVQLDHTVRQMELDMLELKNQMQSCSVRLQFHQQAAPTHPVCCYHHHPPVQSACSCSRQHLRASNSLYTLV